MGLEETCARDSVLVGRAREKYRKFESYRVNYFKEGVKSFLCQKVED